MYMKKKIKLRPCASCLHRKYQHTLTEGCRVCKVNKSEYLICFYYNPLDNLEYLEWLHQKQVDKNNKTIVKYNNFTLY